MAAFAANLVHGTKDLRGMRHALLSWLELEHAPEDVCNAVILATHEAAANAMVHGDAKSPVTVSATQSEDGGFTIEVINVGGWKQPQAEHAGRGLAMMTELMRDVAIHTRVRMLS